MPNLMHLALGGVRVLVETWVLVLFFITWCSAFSLTRQHPCHYFRKPCRGFWECKKYSSKSPRMMRVASRPQGFPIFGHMGMCASDPVSVLPSRGPLETHYVALKLSGRTRLRTAGASVIAP